jgi:hypothetical protein
MTEKKQEQWYMKPISVPMIVLLAGGLGAGSVSDMAKGVLGIIGKACSDSVARESVEVVERRISRVERTLDSVVFMQGMQLELLKSIRRDQMRGHQGAED